LNEVYNGEKKTTTYHIDSRTGDIQTVFSASGMPGMVNKKQCIPTTGLQKLECETPKPPEKVITVARTGAAPELILRDTQTNFAKSIPSAFKMGRPESYCGPSSSINGVPTIATATFLRNTKDPSTTATF
jgi:hypothetical protein